MAAALQLGVMSAAIGVVAWAARRAAPDAGYLVAVVASQLVSPILWDHYAMLLLLPVAWLLERRHWWAALVPMATSVVLVGVVPPIVYPASFVLVVLVAVLLGARNSGAVSLPRPPR